MTSLGGGSSDKNKYKQRTRETKYRLLTPKPKPLRAVTQGTGAGVDLYQGGSPVFIHTVFELLCSNEKEPLFPSPVLSFYTLLAMQFCFALGMPQSYYEWKEHSVSPPPNTLPSPSIPWNWTGDYSPHVHRIVFPPPPEYRSLLSKQASGIVWLFFWKNFSVGLSHS